MSIKYYNKIFHILFCMMILFSSCNDIIVDENVPIESNEMVPIALNLKGLFGEEGAHTYSLADGGFHNGFDPESDITDVKVFVFNANTKVCEKIMVGSSPDIEIVTDTVKAGNKIFIAVINGNGTLSSVNDYNPGDEALVIYSTFRQLLTKATMNSLPVAPFLMTGEVTETLIPVAEGGSPNEVEIEVYRAVAKVKLYVSKSSTVNQSLHLQKVTLNRGARQVYLLDKPLIDTIKYDLTGETTRFNPTDGEIPVGPAITTNAAVRDTFYTYESLCGTDTTKAVYFDLEVLVGGSNTKRGRVYLGEDKISGDTVYNVKRNYWYNVYINIGDAGMDSIDVKVISCPWNVAPPMDTIIGVGGTFETATPFRLVKNYTWDELDWGNPLLTNNGRFALIDNHSKGASWIEYSITKDTYWNLMVPTGGLPRNDGVKVSLDSGKTWETPPLLALKGDGNKHRLYIYRPYDEQDEHDLGPLLYAEIQDTDGTYKFVRNFVVQPRDITPFPTNSFILRPQRTGTTQPVNETRAYIPLASVYSYWEDYLLDNGQTITGTPVTYELLWEDRSGVLKNISIINDNKRDSAYLYAEAGAVSGNATIAMKVNNIVYWSFHFWVTEYNPNEAAGQKLYNGLIFMDRALGAMTSEISAQGGNDARGLFYQYGRKDPFPETITSSSAVSNPAAETVLLRPKTAMPAALKNPRSFYTTTSSWSLSDENQYLWISEEGNKTAFDPCPEGWRIPVQNSSNLASSPWNGLNHDGSPPTFPHAVGNTNGRYNDKVGYYEGVGYLHNSSLVVDAVKTTYFWSTFSDNTLLGNGLKISSTEVNPNSTIDKSWGNQVRCVKEKY